MINGVTQVKEQCTNNGADTIDQVLHDGDVLAKEAQEDYAGVATSARTAVHSQRRLSGFCPLANPVLELHRHGLGNRSTLVVDRHRLSADKEAI